MESDEQKRGDVHSRIGVLRAAHTVSRAQFRPTTMEASAVVEGWSLARERSLPDGGENLSAPSPSWPWRRGFPMFSHDLSAWASHQSRRFRVPVRSGASSLQSTRSCIVPLRSQLGIVRNL